MTNKRPCFVFLALFLVLSLHVFSQNDAPAATAPKSAPAPVYSATPPHMWEFGLHGGAAMSFGDVDFTPNWGVGLHFRRAIDYVFSLRGEGLYGVLKNDDNQNGTTEATFQSASLQLLVSVNNLKWNGVSKRKVNVFGMVGGGGTRYKLDVISVVDPTLKPFDYVLHTHVEMGVGIAFRIADWFNLGFETKAMRLFGDKSDHLDGIDRDDNDILNYSSLRFNFNLGNKDKRSEPLYWVNPLDVVLKDVSELKNRPAFDLTDSDGDGVIDLLDQEPNSPPGAIVDTRGKTLDSDGDGIPDHEDKAPYVHKDKERRAGAGPGGDEPPVSQSEVTDLIRKELKTHDSSRPSTGSSGNLADWFLPMIHFNIDSYKIRFADYGHIASVARVMKSNPDLRVVVTGFTDKTASAAYNLQLSYRRANAAVEHLVNNHGIARSRLILQYNGEDIPLVPSTGSSFMNRRVEFRVATAEDREMDRP